MSEGAVKDVIARYYAERSERINCRDPRPEYSREKVRVGGHGTRRKKESGATAICSDDRAKKHPERTQRYPVVPGF